MVYLTFGKNDLQVSHSSPTNIKEDEKEEVKGTKRKKMKHEKKMFMMLYGGKSKQYNKE